MDRRDALPVLASANTRIFRFHKEMGLSIVQSAVIMQLFRDSFDDVFLKRKRKDIKFKAGNTVKFFSRLERL